MKTKMMTLAIAGMLAAGMASCKKKDMPQEPQEKEAIEQTESVSLKPDESYSYVLPKNLRNDKYEIVTQAGNYSESTVTMNSAGDYVYTYKPAPGFTGSDVVVLSNDHEKGMKAQMPPKEHKHPPLFRHKKHECKKGDRAEEDHYVVTINFNVKGIAVPEESAIVK
jgi:hypothetical protein